MKNAAHNSLPQWLKNMFAIKNCVHYIFILRQKWALFFSYVFLLFLSVGVASHYFSPCMSKKKLTHSDKMAMKRNRKKDRCFKDRFKSRYAPCASFKLNAFKPLQIGIKNINFFIFDRQEFARSQNIQTKKKNASIYLPGLKVDVSSAEFSMIIIMRCSILQCRATATQVTEEKRTENWLQL